MGELRIVILGKTGNGKSSLANTIFGEKLFTIGHQGISETKECGSETRRVDGRDVTLIDNPGLFDTDLTEEKLKAAIVKCITECSPGPHAFLIVFKVERFTEQEQDVINTINQYFSEEAFKYATLLFTYGDQLEEGQTIEEYFCNNHLMRDLMQKCGGRCHVVDNKYWKNQQPDEYRSNQFHVKQLLETIDHMIETNNRSCYTNEMLQAVERMIQKEMEEIKQSPGNKTEKEIIEEATRRARKRVWIELAGASTGAVLGAFLGGAPVVGAIVKVLEDSTLEEPVLTAIVSGAAVKIAGTMLVAGAAIRGGVTGYKAAQEAETVSEAVLGTVKAVPNEQPPSLKSMKNEQRKNLN